MSNNKQQTAVEWLVKQLQSNIDIRWRGTNIIELVEQAKEMEKEQIVDAHIEGQRVFDDYPHTQWTNDQAEVYYNETFNTKEK